MKNITTCLILFSMFTPFNLFGQSMKEDMLILKIEAISEKIKPNSNVSTEVKALKELTTLYENDLQISAVSNALAGKALSTKGYYDKALPFLEKSYDYRKQIGIPKPQKWALKALMNNRNAKNDLKGVVKYAELWIKLIVESKEEDIITSEYFSVGAEINYAISYVSPINYLRFDTWAKSMTEKDWVKRRETGHQLIKTCLKKYPKFRKHFFSNFPDNAVPYYSNLMNYAKATKDVEIIRYWEKKALKTVKKYRTEEEYVDHLRYFVTFYNGTGKPEIGKYEAEGNRLMKKYIKECTKIKHHKGVTFGHRYMSRRLRVAKDYQKSIQHLAEAIKYCRKHGLSDYELTRAFNGLFPIVHQIKDQSGLDNAKKWKEKFSLKGLTEEDIKKIEDIIILIHI